MLIYCFQVLVSPAAGKYWGRYLGYKQRFDGGTELLDKALVLLVDVWKEALVTATPTVWSWS